MKIEITEKQCLNWEDYLEFVRIMVEDDNKKFSHGILISNLLYFGLILFWIYRIGYSGFVLFVMPIVIIDVICIGLFLYLIVQMKRFQNSAIEFLEAEKEIVLVFEEEQVYTCVKESGKELVLTYDKVKVIELKNVFIINVPAIIKKDSEEANILVKNMGERIMSTKRC